MAIWVNLVIWFNKMCRELELSYYQLFPDFKLPEITMLISVFDSVSVVYASRGAFPVAFAAIVAYGVNTLLVAEDLLPTNGKEKKK